jgi:hypothetical protein
MKKNKTPNLSTSERLIITFTIDNKERPPTCKVANEAQFSSYHVRQFTSKSVAKNHVRQITNT